jgi:hypothetical protein
MVEIRYILVFVLFVISVSFSNAQNYFYKTYNGGLYDVGQGVCELPDEHYAVTGSTSSIEGSSQAFIMVLDSVGNQIWTKGYGAEGINWGRRIFHRENEGFWMMGYSTAYGDGDFEFVVWKIDEDGEQEWVQNYGTVGWDRLWDAVELDNGDFILVGETEGENSLDKDVLMLRIADQGSVVWQNQLENEGDDIAYAITAYDDTTVIVVGQFFENDQNVGMLLNMHIDGTIHEQWNYDDEGPTTFLDVDVWNGEVYLAGGIERNNNGYLNSVLLRLNDDLIITNSYITNWIEDDFASNILVLSPSRIFWSMWSVSPDHNVFTGGPDVFLIRFHPELYFLGMSIPHAGVDPDEFHQFLSTSDGGFIAVGYCSDNRVVSSPGFNVMVSKFGPDDEYQAVSDENEDFLVVEDLVINNVKKISVFPIPTQSILFIESEIEIVTTQLIDPTGKVINSGHSSLLDMTNLKTGIYYLQIHTVEGVFRTKVIRN